MKKLNMKLGIYAMFVFLMADTQLNAQTTFVDSVYVPFQATSDIKCKGDNTIIEIRPGYPNPIFPQWWDHLFTWDTDDCAFDCSIKNILNPSLVGNGIVSQTSPPPVGGCNDPVDSYYFVCGVNPQVTTTYTLSYSLEDVQAAVNDPDCSYQSEELHFITVYHGEITIYVSDPPAPELTIDNATIHDGETVIWDITNCNGSSPFPYEIMIDEGCTPEPEYDDYFTGTWPSCLNAGSGNFESYSGWSGYPEQVIRKYQFFNVFNGYGSPVCKGDWTELVINVLPPPTYSEHCADLDGLLNDYTDKRGTPEGAYAHQYSCLALKACEEYGLNGESGWSAGFVKYSFDWMAAHTDRVNGSDVECGSIAGVTNSFCSFKAGGAHFKNELFSLFMGYTKFIEDENDIDDWTLDHDAFIINAVLPCFNQTVACGELYPVNGGIQMGLTVPSILFLRSLSQNWARVNFTTKNIVDFVQGLSAALTQSDLFVQEISDENTLSINEDEFFIPVGDSLDLEVSPLVHGGSTEEKSSMSYYLSVGEDIATVTESGILKIHNTYLPVLNGRAMIYVLAVQGDDFAIGQYAVYDDNDSDNDGIVDSYEIKTGLDPNETNGFESDLDGDGLSDLLELMINTDPLVADTDGDGASDGEEFNVDIDPLDPNKFPCNNQLCFTDCDTVFNVTMINYENYQANAISSSATVYDSTETVFEAEQNITLNPGFQILSGGSFSALISVCDSTNVGGNGNEVK